MFRIIIILSLLGGILAYGPKVLRSVRQNTIEFINPEFQKAALINDLETDLTNLERIFRQVGEHYNDSGFDTENKIQESLGLVESAQGNIKELEKIEQSKDGLIVKTIESVRGIIKSPKSEVSQCQCTQ